ncbi:MAG: ATP-binding protein [Nocardioides sp.]
MTSEDDRGGWSDSSARAVLQLMVESVAEMVGFEVALLSVVLDEQLVTVAYTGPEEFRAYLEEPDPVAVLDSVLAHAVEWGPRLRFIPATEASALDGHWVILEQATPATPDAWHPEDALLAVLTDDVDGRPVGVLSVDKPLSGRKPDARQRSLLERYAAQAERAVLTAFEREALVQQVAHAESARRLIRAASMPVHASLEEVLRTTHRPLVEGFGASGSWIQLLRQGGGDVGYARSHDGEMVHLDDDVVALAEELAPDLWRDQRILVVSAGETTEVSEVVHRQLADLELSSVLAVPLGVGAECLGFLVLSRRAQDPPWTQVELDSALQIGHDLGAALVTARALERERSLVHELQQLDDYRSHLIATLSHELRTPLTVIAGNLEMLGGLDLDETGERHHQAMTRGTARMERVVEDLLLLAQVSNPQHPLVRVPVDLGDIAREVVDLVASTATAKGVDLCVAVEPRLQVGGDPSELDRLVGNLVSNAVKYTPAAGTVSVSVARREDRVVLEVSDDGIGISEEDQVGLFGAFFRTTNPDALREPGTGLGLAIVATIVERHDGTVAVASTLGDGTTFTVSLPAG